MKIVSMNLDSPRNRRMFRPESSENMGDFRGKVISFLRNCWAAWVGTKNYLAIYEREFDKGRSHNRGRSRVFVKLTF